MMNRKKTEVIAIGALAVVFALVLLNSVYKIYMKVFFRKPGPGAVSPAVKPAFQLGLDRKERKSSEETVKLAWGRDPFVLEESSEATAGTVSGLRLTGITTGRNIKTMAIINNEIVTIGSKIGNFKVLKIEKDKVVVTDGKENHELKLTL